MRTHLLALLIVLGSVPVAAQNIGGSAAVAVGNTVPAVCTTGQMYLTLTSSALYICTATNTWTPLAKVSDAVQPGTITLVTSGTCPSGYTEVSALNGVMLRGTLAANGNVGTTGGSDTATPTVSTLTAAAQTFTGSQGTTSAISAGTPAGTNGTVAFTPTGTVAAPIFTGGAGTVPAQIFTGSSATTSAVSAGTPAGTNGTGTVTPLGSNGTVAITPLGTNAASATTGNCAATNLAIGTGATTACKATAPNLTVAAQTFTGSSTTVGAQTFTGSSSVTSAEVFTGSALGTHTHTLTATGTNGTAAFTPAGTNNAPAFTGNSGTVSAETFTGSALGTHTHTLTPQGTNGTSAVTGTMNAISTIPAYVNVIFCAKQ